MYLAIETVVLCFVFWLLCFLGTGGDKKNIKSFDSYPDEVQKIVREREDLAPLIRKSNPWIVFVSNVVTFVILLFIFGAFIPQEG